MNPQTKQNRSITIRLPHKLVDELSQEFNPKGFLTLSQVIRQALTEALSGSLTSNDEVINGGQ
jgi:metal-responsive CopG/Arc/MetJ family transcriptional regulator